MLSRKMDPSSVAHQDGGSVAASVHPQAFGFLVLCVIFHRTNTFRMLKNSISPRDTPGLVLDREVEAWK